MKDLRDDIFRDISGYKVEACITAEHDGVIAGLKYLDQKAGELGVHYNITVEDGREVKAGDVIAVVEGSPKQIALCEDRLIAAVSKMSGVATASRRAVEYAGGRCRVVSGAWKKMPVEIKEYLREAISIGGASFRICDSPFIYLDKNYVKMFGGIAGTLRSVKWMRGFLKAIQVKGNTGPVTEEVCEAVEEGADIVMIDTGEIDHVISANKALEEKGLRKRIQLAFAGGIKIEDIKYISCLNIDALDVGTAIMDAPLLGIKLDVRNVIEQGETVWN